jgi:lipoprotein-releasing system permease protein
VGTADTRIDVEASGVVDSVAASLRRRLAADCAVLTWRDRNRPLFFALRLEKALMFVSVFLIVVVASLALLAAMTLIVAHKRSQLGMLLAMGARPRHLRRAFLLLGLLLAGCGGAAGAACGVVAAWTLDRFRLLGLPGRVYVVDHVPFLLRGGDLALVLAATLVVTLLCASLAARRAAAVDPVEALRA